MLCHSQPTYGQEPQVYHLCFTAVISGEVQGFVARRGINSWIPLCFTWLLMEDRVRPES